MHIAFIGFGEAARAFTATLREAGVDRFSAYDILTARKADGLLREAAAALGVAIAETPAAAIDGADWVISAVTAADSLDAGRSVAGHIRPGQVFVDINSVSAGRKQETAALMPAGVAYVDMAVMAPVHPRGHKTPVLLAGALDAAFRERVASLGFDHDFAGDEVGAATTIKMIRSIFVKGLEAITVQALMAAGQAGVLDRIHASLAKSFPGLGWPQFARYEFERVATHGIRRAAEMVESAATMGELGFPAGRELGLAIAAVQRELGELGVRLEEEADIAKSIDAIAAARRN